MRNLITGAVIVALIAGGIFAGLKAYDKWGTKADATAA